MAFPDVVTREERERLRAGWDAAGPGWVCGAGPAFTG